MVGGSNRLLSAQETADMLGISRQTLYNRWKEWGLRSHKVGRCLRFRERDIESWLTRQAA
ncbi:helix-turn-helix domain-containing protein [Nocardiopsis sp. FR26]|uniref:helix-turn-helix domain-containing protein n=1 Tax=Nocardiopsis sp. FR26 TaxID=2605987 RepID=UPI00135A2FF1|nr:helix-turn-helix domain-containing protein [Nocardiopsis sp. FR26]